MQYIERKKTMTMNLFLFLFNGLLIFNYGQAQIIGKKK